MISRIILAAEGPSDVRRVRALLAHLLGPSIPFEHVEGKEFITLKDIPRLVRSRGLDQRYSSNDGCQRDGVTLRKLIQVLKKDKLLGSGCMIVWARDDDGDSARRGDAEHARGKLQADAQIILAIASECGEAWVIAGFEPGSPEEEEKLRAWRKKLGFSPHREPHLLSHKENVPKSAKGVLYDLLEGDREREERALIAAVEGEDEVIEGCGLLAFRDDVRSKLLMA